MLSLFIMNFSTYFLLIGLPLVFGLWSQWHVSSIMKRYKKMVERRGLSGREAAQQILEASGIHDVKIISSNSIMGDHYNPTDKTLHLSRQ